MNGNSYFLDSLKLYLKGRYVVSDKDLVSLSDIILKYNLEEIEVNGFLIKLLFLLDSSGTKFPLSYNFLKVLWEKQDLTFNFEYIMSKLIEYKLITLRRLTEATFFGSDNINKSPQDIAGEDYYIVVYGTSLYNEIVPEITTILTVKVEPEKVQLTEGYCFTEVNKKFESLFIRLKDELAKSLNIKVSLESFTEDVIKYVSEMNLVFNHGGKIVSADTELSRVAKKYIGKNKAVKEFEIFNDGSDEIYINIVMDKRDTPSNLFRVADSVMDVFEDILGLRV